ncbi:MAG: hypothetical protein R3D05_04790 [Dongiaceae bacterium]
MRTQFSSSLLAAALLLAIAAPAAQAWERPHGDGANSGFVDVKTLPAKSSSAAIGNIGTFATGAGPVVAPDGTVYLGNEQGMLMAFHPDGKPYWNRNIALGESIVASPVIDSQGNVFVVGIKTKQQPHKPDEMETALHKFTASGGYVFKQTFPAHGGGTTTAAPNIWRYNGAEAVIVPINYNLPAGYETRLMAFSTNGGLLADTRVSVSIPTATGGVDNAVISCAIPPFITCLLIRGFTAPYHPDPIVEPAPTAAVFTYAGGGTPIIVVADGFMNVVGFTFDSSTMTEIFRVTDSDKHFRSFLSTPMVTPDGHTLVTSSTGFRFLGPNMTKVPAISGVYSYAPPTLLPSGKVAVVVNDKLAILQGGTVEARLPLGGPSVVSAAASRNHLFVATANAFVTYDAATLQQVEIVNWTGGGLSQPVIGPDGHVYVIAANNLLVFPAPINVPIDAATIGQPQGVLVTDPAQQTSQSSPHLYHPPTTSDGNRLFACEELDQDGCGKGDYQTISLAFCQKQGFAKASSFDVDSKKVKAETLDGRYCSKSKCKVFAKIECKM